MKTPGFGKPSRRALRRRSFPSRRTRQETACGASTTEASLRVRWVLQLNVDALRGSGAEVFRQVFAYLIPHSSTRASKGIFRPAAAVARSRKRPSSSMCLTFSRYPEKAVATETSVRRVVRSSSGRNPRWLRWGKRQRWRGESQPWHACRGLHALAHRHQRQPHAQAERRRDNPVS